jgi:hypothetical protein
MVWRARPGKRSGPRYNSHRLPCWWCNGPLEKDKAGGLIYVLVKDPLGHEHKVHKVCEPNAKAGQKNGPVEPWNAPSRTRTDDV